MMTYRDRYYRLTAARAHLTQLARVVTQDVAPHLAKRIQGCIRSTDGALRNAEAHIGREQDAAGATCRPERGSRA
jgi:hypothetical protein